MRYSMVVSVMMSRRQSIRKPSFHYDAFSVMTRLKTTTAASLAVSACGYAYEGVAGLGWRAGEASGIWGHLHFFRYHVRPDWPWFRSARQRVVLRRFGSRASLYIGY